ncbi:helix-turn-helix domain-containing protein [Actinocrispum wychmicini]|uniref:helix-turn-helix domain-containing protein n=1 Tax=Actinocrispum wychmicini TaxID=1213861 RepID=UPI0014045524|nr:helix-turn-helix domain-containing protein [Actinocrispum wychmicini]
MTNESVDSEIQAEKKRGRGRPRKTDLTSEIVGKLLAEGLTQTQIAIEHNISKQTVSALAKDAPNRVKTPRQAVQENFPWPDMASQFKETSHYRQVVLHGEYIATGGEGMSRDKLARVVSFYKRLRDDNVVIVFDPEIPPSSNKAGGWGYLPREEGDADLILRVNRYTVMTDEGREIWRMPAVDPIIDA